MRSFPKVALVTLEPMVRVVLRDGFRLAGACQKCGACCEMHVPNCPHLQAEVSDGIAQKICGNYRHRPFYCALWPRDPSAGDLPEGCGYRWEVT